MAVVLEGSGNDATDLNLRRVHALNSISSKLGGTAPAEYYDSKGGRLESLHPDVTRKLASAQIYQMAMFHLSKPDGQAFRCASVECSASRSVEDFSHRK